VVAVPTPLDWTANAGQYASAAMLKAGVGDPLTFLLDPPRCVAYATAAQSIPNSSFTSLALAAEDVDNEATASHLSGTGMHDLVTNNSRLVARTAGTYMCTGMVAWAANATNRRGTRWAKNGVALARSQQLQPAAAAVGLAIPARTIYLPLAVGDYVELQAFQDSGGALSTDVTSPSGVEAAVRWSSP
jgi:hypothetical protein